MASVPEIFERIYSRHGHRCPMSTLGGVLGMAAIKKLGRGSTGLQGVYHARTCALDGIAEVTGCSEEYGSLRLVTEGRHVLYLTRGSHTVEACLTENALELAGSYRSLCDRLERGWDSLTLDEQAARKMTLAAALDELLPLLWFGDESRLVRLTEK